MKNYSIEVKEHLEKPKKREQPAKSSDSFLLPLFLAIVVGIWISPDLIDIRDYIPKDKYGNLYQSEFKK
jgi:hypothetical protein